MLVDKISLKKRLAFKLHNKFRDNEIKLHQLDYIFWECTLRCNLNCRHCGSDCSKDAKVADMPLEDFLKAIDDVYPIINPSKTIIVLTGGEAILREDIFEIGKALKKRGLAWGVVSNGFNLKPNVIIKLVESGLKSITISLDGLEESHNWLRRNKKSFERSINAIRNLSKIKGLTLDVITCVNQKNYPELYQVYKLLLSAGLKRWRIFTIAPIGRAKDNLIMQLPPKDFKDMFDLIEKIRAEGLIKLNYSCDGFLGDYEGRVRDNFFFCRAGVNVASVLVDGSISACPNLRANFIQGNIYQDSFRDVWENRYQLFRDRSWTKTGECADCKFFNNCQGNGMHLRDEKSGELVFCHLNYLREAEK